MTAVDWLFEHLSTQDKKYPYFLSIFKQAKQMEKDKEYETKAYWFGRGILAGRENRIEELQPKQTEQALQFLADQAQELNMGYEKEISDEEIKKTSKLSAVKYLADAILSQRYNKDIFDLHDIIHNAFLIENELLEELSDMDIKKGIKKEWTYSNYQDRHWMEEGAKWYREQIKKK